MRPTAARACTEPSLAPLMTRAVNRLLGSGHRWLKLSGAYMAVPYGSPDLHRLNDFVANLGDRFASRLVWGTDWPHAIESVKPDDAALANLLARSFPQPVRDSILPPRSPGRHLSKAILVGILWPLACLCPPILAGAARY